MTPTFQALAKAKAVVLDRGVTHGAYFASPDERCPVCFVAAVAIGAGFQRPPVEPERFPADTPASYLSEHPSWSWPIVRALYDALPEAERPNFDLDRQGLGSVSRTRQHWIGLIDWFDGESDGRAKTRADAIDLLQRAANAVAARQDVLDDYAEAERADAQQARSED